MGKTIDFDTENEFKLKLVRKWLKKNLVGDWKEKELNNFIINTLLKQYENNKLIIATIKDFWRNEK